MPAELLAHRVPVDLDAPDALDPDVVGAKAAHLAAARRAALPVRAGLVLPVNASRRPLERGSAVASAAGLAAARLAVADEAVTPALAEAARVAFGDERLVARSSSPLEDSGAWSGAFTSYVGVGLEELPVAVRGCWASMFGRDANERLDAVGRQAHEAGMAVLVQQCLDIERGGVATVEGGEVEVTVALTSLPAMLQGWDRGARAVAGSSGPPSGPAVDRFGAEVIEQVAHVATDCVEATGDDRLEWALVDDGVVILQCGRVARPRRRYGEASRRGDPALRPVVAVRTGRPVERDGGSTVGTAEPSEPWLLERIRSHGTWREGEAASGGAGVGGVLAMDVPGRLGPARRRYVLYLAAPQPGFAPLLWGAAGLVTAGGNAGAHLFEVARSLGVPAVAGCEIPEWRGAGDLTAAVDGSSGEVGWL